MTGFDVAVVGAGPSGCAAAIEARRSGLRVVVLDRADFPRDKTCGDGLTAGALRLLEHLGLARDDVGARDRGYQRITEVSLRSPSGRIIELPLPHRGDYAAVVSRCVLDSALLDAARRAGAEVREQSAVEDVTHVGDEVVLDTAGGDVRAPRVIAAYGHWSTVRRIVRPGEPRRLGEWHAVRQYHRAVNTERMWVFFERDLLPGYAWVFPLPNGQANVGYGVLRSQGRRGAELKALWPALLERASLRDVLGDAQPIEPVRAWPIPTRYDPRDLATGRVLFAGDAASMVDPMTGEGIAQALETGMLAARAVAGGGDVGGRYRRSVQRTLGRDLRFAALLARVLARPLGARAALRTVDSNEWTRRQFARWMFEDYPRAALFTPSRWRAIVATRPGAYASTLRGLATERATP